MQRPTHGGNLAWAAQLAGCSPSVILDFSASINPLGPPDIAIAAINRGLSALNSYPDPNYSELKAALATYHQLEPEWILPGNGAAELLTWAALELSQGSLTYLLAPAFADYRRALTTFGAEVQPCLLDWEEGQGQLPLEDIISSAGLLLNNPHNPTGMLFSLEQIKPYLEAFVLVVIDEAFMDFLPPQQQQSLISLVADYPNLVILRSLTKFYSLPGLRIGYAIAHPDRLRRWQSWRDPWSVNILAAQAAAAVLEDRHFQQQTWDWLIPAREQLQQGLASLPGLKPYPSAANFLLVQTAISSSRLQTLLLKQEQILIRDCLSFPELGDRYFRVAVRTQGENQRLIQALADVV